MAPNLRVALLQVNPTAGDISGNSALIVRGAQKARELGADLAVTSELALMGYLPRDLLMSRGFVRRADLALPLTAVFMMLAGGLLLFAVNHLLRTRSFTWTLSSIMVVIFACGAAYHAQQIRDFYQEFDDDNAEGWKASVLGALLLLINSVNLYLLVATFMPRADGEDSIDSLPR